MLNFKLMSCINVMVSYSLSADVINMFEKIMCIHTFSALRRLQCLYHSSMCKIKYDFFLFILNDNHS